MPVLAKAGSELDKNTMDSFYGEETNDPKYKGKETIASVEEEGFIFRPDLQLYSGERGDVISPAQVIEYKYVGK